MKQNTFSILFAVYTALALAIVVGIALVTIHFIAKYW